MPVTMPSLSQNILEHPKVVHPLPLLVFFAEAEERVVYPFRQQLRLVTYPFRHPIFHYSIQQREIGHEIFLQLRSNSGLRPATLLNKRLWQKCFPVNFPFLQKTSGKLLLSAQLNIAVINVATQLKPRFREMLVLRNHISKTTYLIQNKQQHTFIMNWMKCNPFLYYFVFQ